MCMYSEISLKRDQAGISLSEIIMRPKQDEIGRCEQFYPGTSQALRLKRVTVHMAASDSL